MNIEDWNRCDACGRFIALAEFADETAIRRIVTPDAYGYSEEWETLHNRCDTGRDIEDAAA